MKVISILLSETSKPIRNNSFISVEHAGHKGVDMEMVGEGNVSIIFPAPAPGHFFVPASSISWLQVAEPVVAAKKPAPARKKKKLLSAEQGAA
tara:strand:+ start:2022 stop:2300 length:279 start_codon:yes stop_codon:yes gene_type:complete